MAIPVKTVPADDLPANLVPASDLPDHLVPTDDIPTVRVQSSRPKRAAASPLEQPGDVPGQQPPQAGGNFYASVQPPPADMAPIVQKAAAKYGVPLNVAYWVGYHESGWNPGAVGQPTSTGRAQGAWQFMDATAKQMGLTDPHDFTTSTDAAMRYLRQLADRNGGDWTKAVHAYGTFSTGMGARRDAAAQAGFSAYQGAQADRYKGWDTPGGPAPERDPDEEVQFPDDDPGRNYGLILPYSTDAKTGEVRWGIEENEVVRGLARGLRSFGNRMSGPLTPDKMHGLTPDEQGVFLTMGGMPQATETKFAATGARAAAERAAALKAANDQSALARANEILGQGPEGKARRILDRRLNQDIKGGNVYRPDIDYGVPQSGAVRMPAEEMAANLERMRESGKPATIMHVAGPNVQGQAGKIARAPGPGQAVLRQGMKEIDAGAYERNTGDVARYLTKGSSAYRTVQDLLAKRSREGRPLYDQALAGGSMAPLEAQFQAEWVKASRAVSEAGQAVEVAKSQLNAALAKQTQTGGNVYSTSAANQEVRAAQSAVRLAEEHQARAQQAAAEVQHWMNVAQEDRINNTPGAVWNPRIQEMLNRPKVKAGLKLGYEIQGDEAAAAGTPFNPREFAIDPDGNLIRVPNMRTLNVAKKGLDRMYSATLDEFGRPNEEGVAIDKLRRALLQEMDAINPDYAAARQAWAEDSQNIDAIKWAKGIDKLSPEQVAQEFSDMSQSEQEFARLGVADRLLTKIGDTAIGADEAKNLLKNQNTRDRLQPIFRTQEEFQRYLEAVADERRMYDVNTTVLKNSPTAARMAEDFSQDLTTAGHLAHGAANLAHGRLLRALSSGFRAGRELMFRPNHAVDEALARQLLDQQASPVTINGRTMLTRPAPPLQVFTDQP
jgi:hypothetical protein